MTEIRLAIPTEIDRYLDALVRTGPFGSKAELVRAALVSYAQTAGPIAQDFDKANLYSPDGRIYQIEYARESSRRGLPIVGAVYDRGVVLGANVSKGGNPTMKPAGKVLRLSPQVMVAAAGLTADARAVMRHLRRQTFKSAEDLIDDLSQLFFEHTIRRDIRPLGCALLVATVFDHVPRLFEVDPSGASGEAEADILGQGIASDKSSLLGGYRVGKLKEAEALVGRLLGKEHGREVHRLES